MRYQRCTQCVEHDNIGFVTQEGSACTWEDGRYEIGFDSETMRMKCVQDSSDGQCGVDLCKESVIKIIFQNFMKNFIRKKREII